MTHRWKTDDIVALMKGIAGVTVTVEEQGGDYDTESVLVELDGGEAHVFGMNLDETVIVDPTDTDFGTLFVSASERAGMDNASAESFLVCSKVMLVLREAGYPTPETDGWRSYF